LRLHVSQDALKSVLRGKRAGNASEDAEVGVLENVMILYGGLTRIIVVPGAEPYMRANLAGRERVV